VIIAPANITTSENITSASTTNLTGTSENLTINGSIPVDIVLPNLIYDSLGNVMIDYSTYYTYWD
jgi:hypothetical protein